MNKLPPDKYKCIKTKFIKQLNTEIYNKKNVFETINDAVSRTNKIVIKSYMLLRLWLLQKYDNNSDIPIITKDVVKSAFKAVIDNTGKKGKRPNGENALLLQELKELYKTDINSNFENGSKLSAILNYYSITIITSIENNIKNNFILFLSRFVNSYFYKEYEKEIEDKETKDKLIKELRFLKNDLSKLFINFCISSSKKSTFLLFNLLI